MGGDCGSHFALNDHDLLTSLFNMLSKATQIDSSLSRLKSSQNVYNNSSDDQREMNGSQVHRHLANARERGRTRSVNEAFADLRALIPTEPADRKLSKIETLRLATSYINHLNNVISARLSGETEENACLRFAVREDQQMDSSDRVCYRRTNEEDECNNLFMISICTFCLTSKRKK